ncbi:hypothetical protein CVS40_3642 [Lucilia cuprina]|nr:hypothetical protein CVS40_3642 [Lucilia cuprina]
MLKETEIKYIKSFIGKAFKCFTASPSEGRHSMEYPTISLLSDSYKKCLRTHLNNSETATAVCFTNSTTYCNFDLKPQQQKELCDFTTSITTTASLVTPTPTPATITTTTTILTTIAAAAASSAAAATTNRISSPSLSSPSSSSSSTSLSSSSSSASSSSLSAASPSLTPPTPISPSFETLPHSPDGHASVSSTASSSDNTTTSGDA